MKELTRGFVPLVRQNAANFEQLELWKRPFNQCLEQTYRICASWTIILTMVGCLAGAAAYGQQFSVNQIAPSSAQFSNGWWSPELASRVVAPRLELTLTNLHRFEVATSSGPATVVPSHYRLPENDYQAKPTVFELSSNTSAIEFGSLAELDLLHTRTFLPLLEAKYKAWEWSLAETRFLTNVGGVSVYPLVEINYAQWHLPVSLYIPLLRGSDTR